jgi:protease I
MENLKGLKVAAILVTDGFEQVELTEPPKALDQAGAVSRVVSPKTERVRGWKFTEWGDEVRVDVPLARAKPEAFDALLLPGGVMNPDALRMQSEAVEFVKAFFDAEKPVAVICHASSRPTRHAAAGSHRGRRSRRICGTRVRSGSTNRSSAGHRSSRFPRPLGRSRPRRTRERGTCG